ncbi:tetratricopeptide repeat protein [Stappia sp. P2PMeth1]|uniref:tetratricopeptide repeat protein n=1 Tax=Stappia sp. P2PMeth1 TaxID=2003586 RepID=UPI001FCAECDA|nr:tetratricopeptide repeat protein [Stappia sp. P2PMeth1]
MRSFDRQGQRVVPPPGGRSPQRPPPRWPLRIALRLMPEAALARLAEARLTGWGILLLCLGIASDLTQLFGNVAFWAAGASFALALVFLAALVLRTRFCQLCAVPFVVALVSTLVFAAVFGAQSLMAAQARGVIADTVPGVAAGQDWLKEILDRLDKIGEDTAATRQDAAEIRDSMATREDITGLEARLLAAMEDRLAAARASGITDAALIELARRISADVADPQQAFRELENAVEIAIRVQQEGRQGSNLGAFVDEVLARVASLAATGAYDEATVEIDAALAREAEEARLLDERREESRARSLRLLDAGLEQDLLRRDAESAAARLARMVEIERPEGASLFDHLRAVQDDWYERGRDRGVNLDLEVAIALARRMVDLATDADQRGAALNVLGNALQTLGMRETDPARLEDAVTAYRLALEEWTRGRVPLDWAMTQTNLGLALAGLGAREGDPARLEQAVAAYRLALEERTRKRVPLDWAATQNNLGNALQVLGTREAGTARLKEAIETYRLALEEWTRERVPLQWAMTQTNLGSALAELGEREAGTARLEQAVEAFRLALEERVRERVPLDWAATQNNLGLALQTLGTREADTEHLEQAVAAYRLALEEFTRETAPYYHEVASQNLARAQALLDERRKAP